MIGKKIQDQHGHTFTFDGKFDMSKEFPTSVKGTGKMTLNNDRCGNTFILIQHSKTEFSFVIFDEGVFKRGKFKFISYDPKKDMRYIKEEH